jgi:hypothetical protein
MIPHLALTPHLTTTAVSGSWLHPFDYIKNRASLQSAIIQVLHCRVRYCLLSINKGDLAFLWFQMVRTRYMLGVLNNTNMNRRRVLGSVATGMVPFLAGCISSGGGKESKPNLGEDYMPLTEYYFSDTVTYDHDELRLRACDSAVQPGGTIKFKITNSGDSAVGLGCHNPWTIQKRVDGQWRDVVWTSADAYLTCATVLPAGKSTIEKVTISRAALAIEGEKVRFELNPGQYRFVLLSTDPYLAADFHVRAKTAIE